MIWDSKAASPLCELTFNNYVLAVKMNSLTLFAATKDKIFVYTLQGMKLLAKLDAENHVGRIDLSPNSTSHPYLFYATSFNEGTLAMYDTNRL